MGWLLLGAIPLLGSLGHSSFAPLFPGGSASEAGDPVGQDSNRPFLHYDHVAAPWLNPDLGEVERDCLGCHDLDAPWSDVNAKALCAKCHYQYTATVPEFPVDQKVATDGTLGFGYASMEVFLHGEHGTLTCRECHAPDSFRQGQILKSIPQSATMVIRRGINECQRCHETGSLETLGRPLEARSGDSAGLEADSFFSGLNGDPSMGPDALGAFIHGEHMLDPAASFSLSSLHADAEGCATCHAALLLETTQRSAPEELLPQAGCDECHVSVDDSALSFRGPSEALPSLSSGAFFHGDHLRTGVAGRVSAGVASADSHAQLEIQSCSVCHQVGGSDGGREFAFDLAQPEYSYLGCAQCHDTPAWQTQGHGEWTSCTDCHSFSGPTSDLRTDRPLAAEPVARRRPTSFRIESQTHRMITGLTKADLDQACVECHRAPVESLPSRIRDTAFRHSTHLPAEFDSDDCLRCHSEPVAQASRSWELGGALAGNSIQPAEDGEAHPRFGLTYDPDSCNGCHEGAVITPVLAPIETSLTVEFSHAGHLTPELLDPLGEHAISCGDCHGVQGGADLGEPVDPSRFFAKPAECSSCHDHGENAAITANFGGLASSSATSCAQCHGGGQGGGIPFIRSGELLASSSLAQRVATVSGIQAHPNDRNCETCHVTMGNELRSPDVALGLVSVAGIKKRMHGGDYPQVDPNAPAVSADGSKEQQTCLSCHWTLIASSMTQDPFSPEIRDVFGSLLGTTPPRTFPGRPASELR
ncbi:MAG: hypothetical protein ACI8QS_000735 [Planctomycetota bacterium]|jgi:hypothetical protein